MLHQFQNQQTASAARTTLDGLRETLANIGKARLLVAFVCRPEAVQQMRNMLAEFESPNLGLFGNARFGVEVFTDDEQPEPCLAFFDREQLRVYLARNRRCASTGCNNTGARWFDSDAYLFYCDGCAQTIKETQPHLPGFSETGLVRI